MRKEQKKLVFSATSIAFLLLLSWLYVAFFASNVNPFESWKQQLSNWSSKEPSEAVKNLLRRLVRGENRIQLEKTGFACHSDLNCEVCVASKQVRIDNKALTMYIPSSDESQINRTIKPYASKDATAMLYVSSMHIADKDRVNLPSCDFTHDVPAVVFSSGGFSGNLFHEINEMIIPLFITTRHFRSQVKFVIADYQPYWVSKYKNVVKMLSSYDVINLNPAADSSVHCFPGAVLGLKYHNFLSLNSTDIPGGYSMLDFKQFLREAYNLKIKSVSEMNREKKPVLILVSRLKTRVFLNEDEMVAMMEELGFEVVVTRPNRMSNLAKFSKLLTSCRVMVGAHGAGITNEVFLPAGAVMVQVVPLGLEWGSTHYFNLPAKEMGVNHLEYKIEPEESSLIETHGRDDPVITDPDSLYSNKGYYAFRAVYVDGQNLKINVTRFRETLVQAKELIRQLNPMN